MVTNYPKIISVCKDIVDNQYTCGEDIECIFCGRIIDCEEHDTDCIYIKSKEILEELKD